MTREREVGVDSRTKSLEPGVLEMRGRLAGERLVLEIGERAPSPECERGAQKLGCASRIARLLRATPFGDELFEPLGVELTRGDSQ